ncbi:type II secretion system F family protein [Verminephrobacter eiseniae]|uniref:type II secretion system F family protein n=1 Tax=Verminephrobacter eiseniae TaxID=364317 RepID=UPI0022387963|nr:type II secretion system F family protein [Verminephrobacter eiseniae]MCW5233566.1 type II secretion system F family protein [Verminephrobacter eiseniae]MCW5294879.1 type II secretion system F family protein [Verminephrobacter eiseniae]MCW8183760.1 type II secretion system F family protein [Verminephrobacter eiseniae]MCW8222304.1 type II secretion system F family protein [Verminephrobacter eiseniae]MCW8233901.1 type II secretion system F family protein [Verminephrobacter eiseniae]
MPDFIWHAATAGGQVEQGRLSAANAALALKQLRAQGLTPLHLADASAAAAGAADPGPMPGGFAQPRQRQSKGPVRAADILALTSELAIMLRAGLALDNALRVLIDMSHKPSVAALVQALLDAVKGGTPLSRALAAHGPLFGDFYINMVRSGEASGQMSAVLDRLVEHMERQRALRDSVISATIYPAILLAVALLSLVAMLGFVVPQFEKLFTDMGDALPLPTRLVMGLGQAFTDYGWAMGLAGAGAGLLLRHWLRSPAGRHWWQKRVLRLPLVGPLALKYQLTLFARSLGTLLGHGVPMLTALHIATDTVGNAVLQQALARVGPIVKEGGKVVQAVSATGIFAPLAINLIRVGEETGRIGPMMLELANVLNREVETGIRRLLTLLEPVLILLLGLLVAAIIVSILLGILSINDLAV